MRIGIAGKPLNYSGKFIDCLPFLRNEDLNAVEVQFVRGIWMEDEDAKKLKDRAEEHDVKLSVHGQYWINLISKKEETIEKSKKRILNCLRKADEMGAYRLVFHPGFYGDLSKDEAYERMKRELEKIIDKAKKEGIKGRRNGVKIAPETMGNYHKFGSLSEMIKLCKDLDSEYFTMTVDWAHLFARRKGKLTEKENFGEILSTIRNELGKEELENLHQHFTALKWTKEKGEEKHLPIDEGDPKFKPLAKALSEEKVNGVIINESPKLEEDAAKMREVMKGESLI